MKRILIAILGVLLILTPTAPAAAEQVLTWKADNSITAYQTAPAQAVAGATTIVFENSEATGNNTGMPHTLTFDTSTAGYNHDVTLNILANPFDANNGRHEATVTLTPGRYRYFCSIPGHSTMVGEFVVTDGGTTPDTTPPTVSASAAGTQNGDGAYVGSATVTVTASDSGSGVDTVEYSLDDAAFQAYTAPVAVTAVGSHTFRYRATDNEGNVSEVGSLAFAVVEPSPEEDTTPPTVTAQIGGDRDGEGDYLGTATATLTASDNDSGVARIEYSLDGGAFKAYANPVVITTPGMHMLHYRATDNAGNTSAEQMAHFTVVPAEEPDTTPPTVLAEVGGEQNDDGAYVGSATVTVTATDTESEVASIEYALDAGAWIAYAEPVVVSGLGAHTVKARATDTAGNRSAEKSVGFTVVSSGGGGEGCEVPDTRATVVIDGDDTGVQNYRLSDGCTVNDKIAEHGDYRDHAAFVRHVETVTAALVTGGTLTKRQQGTIVRAAARSDIGS
ncbi:plastocyanin/azurin family copper-binding protein [Actinoplanes sp. Pm04-4]|uniref:Plastocyanin/azurin family copper-binding protein n=1 Tax=Paractinoplanes pyxinae TaxID=2997416 RepID=A0ABT4AV38_9ACTN|nr:plastocyanin/azurin family copper-binding protein [Actinoplanes pyxinae]MCY1138110.1 plastocyanin/azurin family copper-binding protein [Actinoplanes pyxinae]